MPADPPIRIRRYPNRRFYDRSRGRYVTLQEIEQLVLDGHLIEVTDSRDGSDITRQILTQILSERHPRKLDMFPVAMLHSIIRANDLVFEFWQSHFRALLNLMDSFPQPLPFSSPLNWFPSPLPAPPSPNPADTTARRVAELEERLRRLESQSTPPPKPRPSTPKPPRPSARRKRRST
ncbi:MAG: hypothetical protein KatS3mg108_3075 [Isosphaeraceae bacterium]|jgi:polyhydroxyalkanoate synthesis repressor PhaR|nr:MAG: hypothetical protein KatS3mg108_3075 [Isosphaeraceae bacterium]